MEAHHHHLASQSSRISSTLFLFSWSKFQHCFLDCSWIHHQIRVRWCWFGQYCVWDQHKMPSKVIKTGPLLNNCWLFRWNKIHGYELEKDFDKFWRLLPRFSIFLFANVLKLNCSGRRSMYLVILIMMRICEASTLLWKLKLKV